MSKAAFHRRGDQWRLGDSGNIFPALPAGTYTLRSDEFGLFLAEADPLTPPAKVYGNSTTQAERILKTFELRPGMTGVLLQGEKGSGKTMLAKQVSSQGVAQGYPTILINEPFHGDAFNGFVQHLHQPCVLLFDEFEKVYGEREEQQALLTLLDGTVPTKKLCLLTVNDSFKLDRNLVNRPGRLFYSLSFDRLGEDFIREYTVDRLVNQSHLEAVIRAATLYSKFNFDQLQALIEEMNRYDEEPFKALQWLNISPGFENERTYKLDLFSAAGEKLISSPDEWSGNPATLAIEDDSVSLYYGASQEALHQGQHKEADFVGRNLAKVARGQFTFVNDEKFVLILSPKETPVLDFKTLLSAYSD